jgi:hypothetical protein
MFQIFELFFDFFLVGFHFWKVGKLFSYFWDLNIEVSLHLLDLMNLMIFERIVN